MTFTGTLLPYQPEALDKMCDRGKVLVAYDLGLGKTVLTIAALERLMDNRSVREPGIIICLSSLKYQWADQIRRFTSDTSNPLVIDGTPKQRAAQYAKALDWANSGIDYIILNYEQVVNDWATVSKLPRGFIVCDEATAIKSFRSKRSKYIKKLSSNYKFALTGTPVENGKPEELYSIMQFVDPTVLGRFDLFDKTFIVRNRFGGVERYRNIDILSKTIKDAAVRKRQEDPDVSPYLPDVITKEPILVPFSKAAKEIYTKITDDLLLDLDDAMESFGSSFDIFSHYGQGDQGGPMDELRGRIMSKLTALRMWCDHPDLLIHSGKIYNPMQGVGSKYAFECIQDGLLDGTWKSPKLEILKNYVDEFLSLDESNKVVIFTTYVNMVTFIQQALPYESVIYTGKLNAKEKELAKTKFQTSPDCRVFISSDAGGYGIDLPQANLLINYDLPWNAGLAVQRNGRIKRASSSWKSVVIQDILMDGSIEQRQHELLIQKAAVASAVVDGAGLDDRGGIKLTAGSLRAFLVNASTIIV